MGKLSVTVTDAAPSDPPEDPTCSSTEEENPDDVLAKKIAVLIEPAKRGHDTAWSELVELLYPTVTAVVRNHLPFSEQEDDITQDIFVKIFMKLEQYKGPQPLTHWVSRIALNTCYDRLRSQKSRPVRSYADLDIDDSEFQDRVPAENVHADPNHRPEATLELLNKLIATLTPDQQIVIRLLDLEEKSISEASDLTGWGASKVKVTAMRARRKLSAALEELENPPEPES